MFLQLNSQIYVINIITKTHNYKNISIKYPQYIIKIHDMKNRVKL